MTLFLTVGVRDTNHRDEFHITTFFRVRFAKGASLLVHWSFSFGVIQIRCSVQKLSSFRITFGGSIWTRGIYFTDCTVFAFLMLKTGSLICFVIRGKHPVCGEPLFCFSANPDSLSELCGFHINHRSRSFLLKVSGVSSHLSFCCTSLVSGLIIQEEARFVYWQTAQRINFVFVQC